MSIALVGARVFDGAHMLDGRAVVIANGRILGLVHEQDLGAGIERRRIEGLLAPGFIDVQVNGGGGVLYNDMRSVGGIRTIAEAHRTYGTTGLLPTFIT
ncbi:MAG: N-acetylglucosamine-6-phosphate deacetylase, partial [Microvirga sp.]